MSRSRRRGDERGSLAPAVPILAFMLLLLAGLGVDFSRALNARSQAVAYAEEAARAGAQQVDLNSTALQLNRTEALDATAKYCGTIAREATDITIKCTSVRIDRVSATDPRPLVVDVTVAGHVGTTLLNMIGITRLDIGGQGRARPYEGIVTPDDGPTAAAGGG